MAIEAEIIQALANTGAGDSDDAKQWAERYLAVRVELEKVRAELVEAREVAQTCTCYDGNPANYEGPHADCAVHGAIKAFNEASRELARLRPVTNAAIADIAAERQRQVERWGEQDHPDVDPRDIDVVTRNEYAFRARRWQEINAERETPTITGGRCRLHPDGPHTHTAWDGVLLEEVYEALAEEDPARRRAELIQVAAVAAAIIDHIDRRTAITKENR